MTLNLSQAVYGKQIYHSVITKIVTNDYKSVDSSFLFRDKKKA